MIESSIVVIYVVLAIKSCIAFDRGRFISR